MEQGMTYLALVIILGTGVQSYYPNLLSIATSHNRITFNKNNGQDLKDDKQPVSNLKVLKQVNFRKSVFEQFYSFCSAFVLFY